MPTRINRPPRAASVVAPGELRRREDSAPSAPRVGARDRFEAGVTVEYQGADKVEANLRAMFPGGLTRGELARMLGVPQGAEVSVSPKGSKVKIEVEHPWLEVPLDLELFKDRQGTHLYIELWIGSDGAPRGTGGAWFGRMVDGLAAKGARSIQCFMAKENVDGEAYFNGYYTWPRFGFDADLDAADKRRLPAALRGAESLSELMLTEGGPEWWRAHGTAYDGVFDLAPDSASMFIWTAYQRQRAARPPGGA